MYEDKYNTSKEDTGPLRPVVQPAVEAPLELPLDVRPEIPWLDFSTIANPIGCPREINEALITSLTRGYLTFPTDRDAHTLREGLSAHFGLPTEAFLCGTGVTEMIRTIAQTYQPCNVGIALPCRPEYVLAVSYAGHNIVDLAGISGYYTPDALQMKRMGVDFDAALLSNPGYPSSRLLSKATLIHYLECCKWVILDERSIELSYMGESMVPLTAQYRNLIVIRSLAETYAMEGAPISYCVAHPDTIKQLAKFFDSSFVSMVAEVVAPVLPQLDGYLNAAHGILDNEIPRMQWMLNLIPGIKVYPAEANYILCELVNDGSLNLSVSTTDELALRMQLLDFGLRALNGIPGLEDNRFFCVAVRKHTENERFVQALRRTLLG